MFCSVSDTDPFRAEMFQFRILIGLVEYPPGLGKEY